MPAAEKPYHHLPPRARRRVEDRQLIAKALGIAAYLLEQRQRAMFGRSDMVPLHLIDTFRMQNLVSRVALTTDGAEAQKVLDEVKVRWDDKKDRPERRP